MYILSHLLFPVQDNKAEFESGVLNISRKFQTIRDEVALQYGYSLFKKKNDTVVGNGTQQQFTAKTRMQCNSESDHSIWILGEICPVSKNISVYCPGVVEEGVQRCADWFRLRWEECMAVIPVPVINHIVCVSMKFSFLCDITRGER